MNQKGFTLLELKMCCAVIALLLALASTGYVGFKNTLELNSEVAILMSSLHLAKLTAIKENNYVVFQLTKNGYLVFVDNGVGNARAGDWIHQEDEEILIKHHFKHGICLYKSTFFKCHGRFSGIPNIKPGRFILAGKNGDLVQVVINRMGRIRSEKIKNPRINS